jgi:hypothetical protein
MNALFLKDLADKTRRGLRGRVELGKSGGGLCYGYKVLRETHDGAATTGNRELVPAEAETIQRIFRDYAAGVSPKALAKQLYVGRLVWNRLRYVKDPDTGKRVSRANAPSEWVTTAVPELRIVDDELWNLVKARQARMRRVTSNGDPERFNQARRPKYLFSGLTKCARVRDVLARSPRVLQRAFTRHVHKPTDHQLPRGRGTRSRRPTREADAPRPFSRTSAASTSAN